MADVINHSIYFRMVFFHHIRAVKQSVQGVVSLILKTTTTTTTKNTEEHPKAVVFTHQWVNNKPLVLHIALIVILKNTTGTTPVSKCVKYTLW